MSLILFLLFQPCIDSYGLIHRKLAHQECWQNAEKIQNECIPCAKTQ